MPRVKCRWCEKEVYKRPRDIQRFKHSFCSRTCQHAWQGRNHKPNTACQQCEKKFFKKLSLKKRDSHHFCSNECYHTWLRRNQISVTCESCGKQFRVPPSSLTYHAARFCSTFCAGTKAEWIALICEQCGKTFKVPPSRKETARFCSRECKYRFDRDVIELTCLECDEAYLVYRSRSEISKFCSLECRITYIKKHKNPLYDRVIVHCDHCKKPYDVQRHKVETTHYCSRECFYAAHSTKILVKIPHSGKAAPLKLTAVIGFVIAESRLNETRLARFADLPVAQMVKALTFIT